MVTDHQPLGEILERLNLQQYLPTLLQNGFDDWTTLLDITEDDLRELGFKLGHRRILQREIATARGLPPNHPLELSDDFNLQSPVSARSEIGTGPQGVLEAVEVWASQSESGQPRSPLTSSAPTETKRRYRRHPKPDPNAPRRPKTAYVNFAENLRADPAISSQSFVDIAKAVGRQWQLLDPAVKQKWEAEAAHAMDAYTKEMDSYKLTDQYRDYQAYLDDFKARQAQKRSELHTSPERAVGKARKLSIQGLRALGTEAQTPYKTTGSDIPQNVQDAITNANHKLEILQTNILGSDMEIYDQDHLPPERPVRIAVQAFLDGTSSFLFLWTREEMDEMLTSLYHPQQPPSITALSQLCAVATVGSSYCTDQIPPMMRVKFHASAAAHLREISMDNPLLALRHLLTLTYVAIIDKHTSARTFLAACFEVVRWKRPEMIKSRIRALWQKVHCSIIFIVCWLSYTLGWPSGVTDTDIAFALTGYECSSIADMIHLHATKISIISSEIATIVSGDHSRSSHDLVVMTEKLDKWQCELPPLMQLSRQTSAGGSGFSAHDDRSILFVHLLYLGAVVLLYRNLIVVRPQDGVEGFENIDGINEYSESLKSHLSDEDVQRYSGLCMLAAQQMGRILSLLNIGGAMSRSCWIIIYCAFSASVILLAFVTQKLLRFEFDHIDENLLYTQCCLNMLHACKSEDRVAVRYYEQILPLYQSLHQAYQDAKMPENFDSTGDLFMSETGFPSSMPPPDLDLTSLSRTLTALVQDPFGKNQAIKYGWKDEYEPGNAYDVAWWGR
ncbi:hypothetical protein M501DRAFT_1013192 [Patellaria atrata CBS 101060]|uniref:HMG box domain-containing protein n=1 Tax=Patellaria atrata CBS 101060 TaxID=1346257 RepID=A0A9P4SFY9_9PEZI|nr:hypothetical protein M501DRAFT_1013192 [Patellaria atrata CBS 101060]